jgi:hypothetical protein
MRRHQQPNDINLRRCVCLEAITVSKSEIEGIYEMYRRVEAVSKLGANGLLIRLQNTQDDPCTAARQLRATIAIKDEEIDKLKEDRVLPLVAKCVDFYGTMVIVRQLKTMYPQDNIINNFRGWADCTAYVYRNNAGQWLQPVINQIIYADPNITGVWDTLRFICERRNIAVHGPITQDAIQLLNDSLQYFQRYQTVYTANYVQAVQLLANALQTVPPHNFAVPGQYDLANLL